MSLVFQRRLKVIHAWLWLRRQGPGATRGARVELLSLAR